MEILILKQGNYLIATVQAAISDAALLELQDELVKRVGKFRTRGVILDVTVLDVMDSFTARTVRAIVSMTKLRGAETVIVGIGPEVAFAMTQLGMTLEGVETALDLDEGLAVLDQRLKGGGNRGR